MQPKVIDKRSQTRKNLLYYVNVYDQLTSEYVGLILDVSIGGVLVSGVMPLAKGRRYKFGLVNTADVSAPNQIGFEAKACWCRKCGENFYDTGFQFTDLPDLTREKLASFI
ncbi:MAG TPA: PilZ domain-containing protein [Pseudomonadales bacterium]|nr:PilZ domain-containing protein [Pseudomonadales bacterium]